MRDTQAQVVIAEYAYSYQGQSKTLTWQKQSGGDWKIDRNNFFGPDGQEILGIDFTDTIDSQALSPLVWTFADPRGTVRSYATSVSDGSVWQIQHREYSPTGHPGGWNTDSGSGILAGSDSSGPLSRANAIWNGHEAEELFGINADVTVKPLRTRYHFGGRVYEPEFLGRMLQPAGEVTAESPNPYTLDGNNPVKRTSNESFWNELAGPDADGYGYWSRNVLNPAGQFGTGVAGVVTFGVTDYLQNRIYGADTYNLNHSGNAYYAGVGAGIGISFVLGSGAAGVARVSAASGRLGVTAQGLTRGLQAYDIIGAGVGAIQSGYSVYQTGQLGLMDAVGFVPALGYGARLARGVRGIAPTEETSGRGLLGQAPGSHFLQGKGR